MTLESADQAPDHARLFQRMQFHEFYARRSLRRNGKSVVWTRLTGEACMPGNQVARRTEEPGRQLVYILSTVSIM